MRVCIILGGSMKKFKKALTLLVMLTLLASVTVAFTACNISGIIGGITGGNSNNIGDNNSSGGTTDDGSTDGGTTDDGTTDDGSTDNTTPDDGSTDNTTPDDGSTDNTTPDDGSTDNTTPDDSTELCVLNSLTAEISAGTVEGDMAITLTDSKAKDSLIVRVPVSSTWDTVKVTQGKTVTYVKVFTKSEVTLVDFAMKPNSDDAIITPALMADKEKIESDFGMTLTNGIKVDTNYYPGFVRKSVTFTIDDGNMERDPTFINIVKPAGILGTFNICRVTDASTAAYLALYDGFEVANHHRLHCLPFRDTADYHTGKSFESILKNVAHSSSSDKNYAYIHPSIPGLYYIDYHYYSPTAGGWHPMASDETYAEYAEITKESIEAVFGEGSVVGFAYPHGKFTETVKQALIDAGYLYARKTGNLEDSTGFALPSDRFAWTYNADVSCLLEVMEKYDALADDGELKFFSFGVHAADFEGKWEVLEEFAELYGNRPEDFWYATNRQIFEYEDAVRALVIKPTKIINPSNIEVYVTVDGEKVIIPANSVYYLSGAVKAQVTFDADNGSTPTKTDITLGSNVKAPKAPTKSGFTFLGWYVGENEWDFNTRITENVTLTAKYKAKPFVSSAEVLPVKGGAGGIVAIIHDDGRYDSGYILDRLYHKYSLVGDVGMLVSNIYNESTEKPKESYKHWANIVSTGRWGVVSHSLTHTWWGKVTQDASGNNIAWEEDAEKMYSEVVTSQQILRNLFKDQRVLSFVYPGFGAESKGLTTEETYEIIWSETARELIADYYIAARYAGENAPSYVSEDSDWYFQDGFFLFPSNINSTGSNSLKNRLDKAASGTIQLISLHAVSDELASGETLSGGYTISSADMETACKMISEYVTAGKVWNAHYDDAILYVREAQNATVTVSGDMSELTVVLTDTMDDSIYNYPLTVRVKVPTGWAAVKVTQGERVSYATAKIVGSKWVIDADIVPDGGEAIITPIAKADIPTSPAEEIAPPASPDDLIEQPEEPITPPASVLDKEVRVDFETDPGVTVDESNSIEFVNRGNGKALHILDSLTTASGNIVIPFGSACNPEALSFTFDINVANATDLAATMYFAEYFNTPYMLTLNASGAGYYIGDCQSNTGGLGATSANLTGATPLSFNTWYTVKIDIVFTSAEEFKATFYVNGTKTGESTNRANHSKAADSAIQNTVKCFKISSFNSALLDMQLDNLTIKAGNANELGLSDSVTLIDNDFDSGISEVTNEKEDRAQISSELREGSTTDKVLAIEKSATSGGAGVIMSAGSSVHDASEFVFEFDINIESANQNTLAQIFFNSNIAKSPVDFVITSTASGYSFGMLNSYSGGSYSNFSSAATTLSFGEYYHVKLHVVIGDASSFTATLYIDGESVGTSNVFLNPNKTEGYQPSKEMDSIYFALQASAELKMHIDNATLTVK